MSQGRGTRSWFLYSNPHLRSQRNLNADSSPFILRHPRNSSHPIPSQSHLIRPHFSDLKPPPSPKTHLSPSPIHGCDRRLTRLKKGSEDRDISISPSSDTISEADLPSCSSIPIFAFSLFPFSFPFLYRSSAKLPGQSRSHSSFQFPGPDQKQKKKTFRALTHSLTHSKITSQSKLAVICNIATKGVHKKPPMPEK